MNGNKYRDINEFPEFDRKHLLYFLRDKSLLLQNKKIYARIIDNKIDFCDLDNVLLWKTTITVFCYIIYNEDGTLFDKFCVPQPFYVRSEYEISALQEVLEEMVEETPSIEMEDEQCYEA